MPPRRRPFEGGASKAANALASGTSALVRMTTVLFGEVQKRSGAAYADFQARPEHSRWRLLALATYGLLVAATLAGQLYSSNSLGAYVRVETVDLPKLTQIFVRNDSKESWHALKLTLNGIYGFETNELRPGSHVLLPANKFALFDDRGRAQFAPRNIEPKRLVIECDRGRYETDLKP